MGRLFLEHMGGTRLFSCAACGANLTNRSELISTRFTGATGRAFLFNKVVNLVYSGVQERVMLTGRYMVRDVSCKKCSTKLGWFYEFAFEENQRYKEGRVILERALLTESDGIEEIQVAPVSDGIEEIQVAPVSDGIEEIQVAPVSDGIEEIQVATVSSACED